MTRQDFQQYLSHPENLDKNTLGNLEKLVREYPYFQAGRMLLLKNLHNEGHIEYEKQLNITTAFAPGGKVLYDLICRKPEKKVQEQTIRKEDQKAQPSTEIQPEASKLPMPKLEPVIVLKEMKMPVPEPAKVKAEESNVWRALEKEMLGEAYRLTAEYTVEKDLLGGVESKGETSGKSAEQAATRSKEEKRARSVPESLMPVKGEHSFTDWLRIISGETPPSVLEEKARSRKQKDQIISEFIVDQAALEPPRPKAEFYSAEGMAKKSLEDNEVFVSETLAGIYLKQGNLPKARRAYEILMVKHPEKIHIFAPLLEKIKKLQEGIKGK